MGSIFSGSGGGGDSAMKEAVDVIRNVKEPTIEEMKIALEKFKKARNLQDTELKSLENIKTDSGLASIERQSLESLAKRGKEGLTDVERNQFKSMERDVASQEQARQASLKEDMQARGMGGSGNEMMARLQSSQSSADRASQAGRDLTSRAQQRAMQNTAAAGTMAGRMGQRDFKNRFDIGSTVGSAQDHINKFNQSAQQTHLNRNTNVAQQQEIHNKGLHQQVFDNSMNKARAVSGALGNYATSQEAAGRRPSGLQKLAAGATRVAAAYYTGGASEAARAGSKETKE